MSAEDWLVALDDALLGYPRCCTVCGRTGPAFWDLATLAHGFGVAYRVCQRCQTQDPTRSAIDRILEARYGRP